MRITLNEWDMKKIFAEWERDYYSLDGYRAILEETPEDDELDVVGVCCTWTEYGDTEVTGCACSFKAFDDEHGRYIYSREEWEEDHPGEPFDPYEYRAAVVEKLQYRTTAVTLKNGNILVAAY